MIDLTPLLLLSSLTACWAHSGRRGKLKNGKVKTTAPDVENGLEDTVRGKGKLGGSERVAWTYIHYQM